MEIKDLKALAYDVITQIEHNQRIIMNLQQQLGKINAEILKLQKNGTEHLDTSNSGNDTNFDTDRKPGSEKLPEKMEE